MTDARFPDRWLNDRRLQGLSDAAFRLYVIGLMWSVSNRSDGAVDHVDVRLMPGVDASRVGDLERVSLWQRQGDSWLIVDFAATQTSARALDQQDSNRARERERKAQERARKKMATPDGHADSPADVHPDAPGQDRKGQARTGQAVREADGEPGEAPEMSTANVKDSTPAVAVDEHGECRDCRKPTKKFILADRAGRCITCNQTRSIRLAGAA